ncbi:tyrosine-protein phosphatase [Cytobacillus sp. Hz8]|uniref:tyrosine-protein phosphatase n=1 Tax=Cytobacillus sp. Hz8 TaxID=3347168 RepID=UPI0035E10E39
MIDIHCHILPSIDDGPRDFASVIEMANQAVAIGVTDLFATPHHLNGRYENTKQEILEGVRVLNQILQNESIPLNVHGGQELRLHREIFQSLNENEILTLDNQGKYLLLELPTQEVPSYTLDIVYELLLKGIIPIIAHPERNAMFQEDPELLFELVQEGALTQLTSSSILGHFGKKAKSFSFKIIEHHLVHFVATDAHNLDSRNFNLHKAYEIIKTKFGIKTNFYFIENAKQLMNGKKILIEEPARIRSRILSFFESTFRY